MNKKTLKLTLKNISAEIGFAYIAHTGLHELSSHEHNSPARILENGKQLSGPANSSHDQIRSHGQGRYSFWHDFVYFSTSDNSSPLMNQKIYEIEYPSELVDLPARIKNLFTRIAARYFKPEQNKNNPVNLQQRDYSTEAIRKDVEYAGQIGKNYLAWLQQNHHELDGKTVLEIGPGINFGSSLVLACFGAKVLVADRFLSRWDQQYHWSFYKLLRDWIEENVEGADISPVSKILSAKGYLKNIIECHETPLEQLTGMPDMSVDYVFSNAVLEHLFKPDLSFEQLARVSKFGAIGYHQVDFRDHLDFSKPLEFLTIDDREYISEMEKSHCERGNRYRPAEYRRLFIKNNFEVIDFQPSLFPTNEYLDEFIPRLQNAKTSKYQSLNREELINISGLFVVQKITLRNNHKS